MSHFRTFDEALDHAGFEERNRQRTVFDAFRAGKHVVLHAPTGWGKTFAVTAALGEGHAIYSLPLRVLVDSLVAGVQHQTLKRCAAQHGNRREHNMLDKIREVEGQAPRADVDLVFTTLDQTLSAFLGIPIGVSLRQGNVLPAVVDASHLVFDEFHLFDPERSLAVALLALQRSAQNGVLLTATLSNVMIDFLEEELRRSPVGQQHGVVVIRGDRPFVNTKRVQRGNGFESMNALEIGQRTLIIRNQIDWAKQTASDFRKRYPDRQVYLLHSELLPDDRQHIEEIVRTSFGQDSDTSGILVATQVVEAGIDITCDVMHTDACPPDAFIQRAGRCARYDGERGTIYWHPPKNTMPYRNREDEINALDVLIGEACDLTPEAEQQIVNLTSERDRRIAEWFQADDRQALVDKARVSQNYSLYDELIRNINSVNVAVGEGPKKRRKFISISRGKLIGGVYKDLPATFYRYDSETKEYVNVGRVPAADFVLLDPEHVGYRNDYGLDLEKLGGEAAFLDERAKTRIGFKYSLESYDQHIRFLWVKKPLVRWMIEKLGAYLAREYGGDGTTAAEMLVDFVIWAHDLGKLDHQWQAAHNVPPSGVPNEDAPTGGYPIAHSDDDESSPYRRQRRPPSHAWVSAWAVRDYLHDTLCRGNKQLFKAIFWAISDHHGYSRNLSLERHEAYRLEHLNYLDAISRYKPWARYGWSSDLLTSAITQQQAHEAGSWRKSAAGGRDASSDNTTYFMLSYILRRCDQFATAEVSRKEKEEIGPKTSSFIL